MKEIIYLDTDSVNSLLAQLDKGVTNQYTIEEGSTVSHSSTTSSGLVMSNGIEAGAKLDTGAIPGGSFALKFRSGAQDNEGETSSTQVTEGQKDLLNKQFHDYSLDILIEKLKKEGLIKNSRQSLEGDIIQNEGKFDFYDFSLIKKASSANVWNEIMKWEYYGSYPTVTNDQAKKPLR